MIMRMSISTFRWLALAILLTTASLGSRALATENEISGGPRELLITYRAEAANRPAFRSYLLGEGSAQLTKLKQQGVLKSFQILFNPYVTPGTWDAMTILSFARYTDIKRWKEVERTMPGGLTAAGLRLAKPSGTYSADLSWEGVSDNPSPERDNVFYVIPYDYNAADQYKKYVNGYVIPQVEGWLKEGVLSRYRIFLNRDPVGPPWDALFIYQYRDLESFGRREEVVAKVRGPLRDDPAWKQLSDIKATLRTEEENTIADLLFE